MRRSRLNEIKGLAGRLGRIAPLAALLALCGCVDAASEMSPQIATRPPLERREGVSLAGATVGIVSIEGAPDEVSSSFTDSLKREAAARDVAIVDAKKARYLVRGYLSAAATKDGAAVEYVWDVFGPDRARAQRLNDAISVKGTGDDPWTIAGGKALDSVAAKSADDLAAFLSHTPEAKPLAVSSQALSYAPVQ